MTATPEYNAWINMRQRCRNPKHPNYPDYGGRGITIAPEWDTFAQFLVDVGERPAPGLTLERIDNGQGYRPGNVRWATRAEQASNRRPRKRSELCGKRLHAMTPENTWTRPSDGARCCRRRAADSTARFREAHPERVAATQATYHAAHRDKRLEYMRERRAAS